MGMRNVIIVEDEAIIAADLEMILESMSFKVAVTDNSDEALDLITTRDPDLILLDININGERDGIELAEIIKEKTKKPFIFITSYADKGTLDRAKHTLPYGYIVKPFNERELKATIEIALFRHANESDNEFPPIAELNSKIFNPVTDKEYEIIEDIFKGLANQQIASKNYISINTVKTHIKNIYSKIGVHNRAELVKWLSGI